MANTAVACAILNIIINLTFIKVLGLYAAALSTCISCFTLFIYRWIDLKKYTEIRFKFIDFKVFIAVASAIIVYYTNMSVISVILIIILITITLILNKNQLKSIKRILYNKIHNGAK